MTKVLVVDDYEGFAPSVAKFLEMDGFHARAVETAAAALAACREETFAVALIDLSLPDMRGRDLVREIAKLSAGTRFILISGDTEDAESEFGADGEVILSVEQKPLNLERISELCAKAGKG